MKIQNAINQIKKQIGCPEISDGLIEIVKGNNRLLVAGRVDVESVGVIGIKSDHYRPFKSLKNAIEFLN